MVVLSIKGLDCHARRFAARDAAQEEDPHEVVKNSLARHVFTDMGLQIPADSTYWEGPTDLRLGRLGTASPK